MKCLLWLFIEMTMAMDSLIIYAHLPPSQDTCWGTGLRSGGKPLGLTSFENWEMSLHLWESQFLICIMGIRLLTGQGRRRACLMRPGLVWCTEGVVSQALVLPSGNVGLPCADVGSHIGSVPRALRGDDGTVP